MRLCSWAVRAALWVNDQLVGISLAVALYEATAATTRSLPTVTDLSRVWPWRAFVWAWWGAVALHLIYEGRRGTARSWSFLGVRLLT